uniref:hypothetical protein n=1 Tax=uncultured Draconibacterium sp. TaxID=1573823 RepID=UPI003217CE74
MKELTVTIKKLFDYKILAGFFVMFLLISIFDVGIVPDFLNLESVKNPDSYLFALWSSIIGSSSIILTILLVVYSSTLKSIKRNSFDFILSNPWIKNIFSLFGGAFLFLSLSIFSYKSLAPNQGLTIIYIASIVTFIFIIAQFPLLILSLEYTNSNSRITNLLEAISEDDILNLYEPPETEDHMDFYELMDKNKIIMLKEIGVNAIKENDWSLPQIIINGTYNKLISPLEKSHHLKKLNSNLFAFTYICDHFKERSVDMLDYITVKVLIALLFRTHDHLADKKILHLRNNPVDKSLQSLFSLIIENNRFFNIQKDILKELNLLFNKHIESINYSDEELPTNPRSYILKREAYKEFKFDEVNQYWIYVTNDLPDLYFEILGKSIELGNKNVYEYYSLDISSSLSIIYNSKNLTERQQDDAFEKYMGKAYSTSLKAVNYDVYKVDFFNDYQLKEWLEKKKNVIYYIRMHAFLLKSLNEKGKLSSHDLVEFLFTIEMVDKLDIAKTEKVNVISIIGKSGLDVYRQKDCSYEIKGSIKFAFDQQVTILSKVDYQELKKEIDEIIT